MRRLLLLASIGAALPAGAQRGATAAPPAEWSAYLSAFDAYTRADSIVGAATLVMRDGRVLAHHETGFADRALGQRVDTNTIFHWGSITKTLTAIAVMQMVERHGLSLDARVTDFIPELRGVHDAWGSMDSVTVQMLLSHASGLQAGTWPWTEGRPWEPFEPTTWEQLVAMMPYQQLAFKPGTRFSYSNPGFIYLARIVQSLTGDPWEAYVQKNIFTPLGLTRSSFNATPWHLAEHRSNNYTVARDSATHAVRVTANGREFNPGITVPNGGWNAPLGDLATYLAFMTNASHGDAATQRTYETIMPHATLERMWQPRYPTNPADKDGEWMATSFFVHGTADAKIVGHTGSQAGFRAFVYWNPATKDAVIAAFNTSNELDPQLSGKGYVALREAAWKMLVVSPPAAMAQGGGPSTGTEVLGRMHSAYDGKWYHTLSFAQKTVRFTPTGERRAASWREYLRWTPEHGTELRIDVGDAAAGNSIRYTADSSWRFTGGKLAAHDANGNAFLPLIEGVYVQPVARTVAELASTHVDLSKVSTQTWNGRTAWVVGALSASDMTSPQFWVDAEQKILVRMILRLGSGSDAADIHLDDYVTVPGGMLATRVMMFSKGSPTQFEEYADWKTGAAIPDSTFALKPKP